MTSDDNGMAKPTATWLPDRWPVTMDGRRRLPAERPSLTAKFTIAGHEGYVTVGMYSETDHRPGEIFITMSKEGSTIRGLMDTVAKQTSLLLQYGVPVDVICDKHRHQRFEPQGVVADLAGVESATSIVDAIFHWFALRFGESERLKAWTGEEAMSGK